MATKKYTGVEPQREPGVFKLRIRVRNRRTGQRINTDRHFRGTLRQAVAERSRLMREFAQGEEEVRYSRTTLGVYARSWISRRKAEGAKPSTLENRVDVLNRHILPDFGDHYVDAVGRADVLAWREQAKERIGLRTKRRVAPATVNGWVRVLQALVASYYADNGLGPSPLTRIRALREPSRRKDDPNTLAPDLLPVVLDKFEQLYPQHYALLFIGLSTGMRWSELSALEWDDIDEEAGVIRSVRGQVRKRVGTRKVDDEVDFPLLPEMLEVLRRHRRRLVEEQSPGLNKGLVFPSKVGGYSYSNRLSKPLDRVRRELGIPHRLTSKVMRRTFNNLLRRKAVDRLVLRSLTGHSSERMTARYSTVFEDERHQAVAQVVTAMVGGDEAGSGGGEVA